jgi:hypothetical protein
MGSGAAGLALILLGLVLLRRDLRALWRRLRWTPATATLRRDPAEEGPAWRLEFVPVEGARVSVATRDLRLVARLDEAEGRLRILYDPAAPGRRFMILPRPGLATAVGLGLAVLGVVTVLR